MNIAEMPLYHPNGTIGLGNIYISSAGEETKEAHQQRLAIPFLQYTTEISE